jgi:hypothetical protein
MLAWTFSREAKAEAEAAAVVAEVAEAITTVMRSSLPELALPKPLRGTRICLVRLTSMPMASPQTPTTTASSSMTSRRIRKLDTSVARKPDPGARSRRKRKQRSPVIWRKMNPSWRLP